MRNIFVEVSSDSDSKGWLGDLGPGSASFAPAVAVIRACQCLSNGCAENRSSKPTNQKLTTFMGPLKPSSSRTAGLRARSAKFGHIRTSI